MSNLELKINIYHEKQDKEIYKLNFSWQNL